MLGQLALLWKNAAKDTMSTARKIGSAAVIIACRSMRHIHVLYVIKFILYTVELHLLVDPSVTFQLNLNN